MQVRERDLIRIADIIPQWSRNRGGQGASGPPQLQSKGGLAPPTMSTFINNLLVTCFIL